jgi:hypothetical protein
MYMLFAGKTRRSKRSYCVEWLDPFDKVLRQRYFFTDRQACEFADRLEWDGIDPENISVR